MRRAAISSSEVYVSPITVLRNKKSDMLNTLFPRNPKNSAKIYVFFVGTSEGRQTLILADRPFLDFIHSHDTIDNIFPVIADSSEESCSEELFQTVQMYGATLEDSPRFVAFQLEANIGTSHYLSQNPRVSPDPQALLSSIIRKEVEEGHISGYRLTAIPNTSRRSSGYADEPAIAFEQEDQSISTCLYPSNPDSFQQDKERVRLKIQEKQQELQTKEREIQEAKSKKTDDYQTTREAFLEEGFKEIQETLKAYNNCLAFLTAQAVNVVSHTTLQCMVRRKIDNPQTVELLARHAFRHLLEHIDAALHIVSWEDLQINNTAIQNFILGKMQDLETKTSHLNTTQRLARWKEFKDQALDSKREWVYQTFETFCGTQDYSMPAGRQPPSLLIQRQWRESLKEKLAWVNTQLRIVNEELQKTGDSLFTEIDIRVFTDYQDRIIRALEESSPETYGLAIQLKGAVQAWNLTCDAVQNNQSIDLVKRITATGKVYFAVTNSLGNSRGVPDINMYWNEVHIPVIKRTFALNADRTLPTTASGSSPIADNSLQLRRWKWIIVGVIVLLGVWITRQYLSRYFSSQKKS